MCPVYGKNYFLKREKEMKKIIIATLAIVLIVDKCRPAFGLRVHLKPDLQK